MLFGGRTIHWPDSVRLWIFGLALIALVFLAWRIAAGLPMAVLVMATAVGGYAVDAHVAIPAALLASGLILALIHRPLSQRITFERAVREGGFVGAGFLAYELGRFWTEGSVETARRNAQYVVDLEAKLGLAFESRLQRQVLDHHVLIDVFNRTYSFLFIPFVLVTLCWLLATDDALYRLLRNSLGASAAIAVVVIALFPAAPPRLMPTLGIVDSHKMEGLQHGFVNEYAAVPSLHVGWMTLCGYVVYRSLTAEAKSPHRRRRAVAALALLPAVIMSITVIVTGNHYWIDGVVGIVIAIGSAVVLRRQPVPRLMERRTVAVQRLRRAAATASRVTASSGWVRATVVSLGSLLAFLTVGQIVEPGFTDYWGYMVGQIVATIVVVIWLSDRFGPAGGLSWITHLIVIGVTYVDTFGTAGHLYERFVTYDKIAHFAGAAALAAAGYDVLYALEQRGSITWTAGKRAAIAIAVATILGGCWEIYEYTADLLFHTYRHAGRLDTTYDLISDATGAAVIGLLLLRRELLHRAPESHGSFDQGQPTQA